MCPGPNCRNLAMPALWECLPTSISWFALFQSLLYKKVHEAQYRSHLANEMMMYHMQVRRTGAFRISR